MARDLDQEWASTHPSLSVEDRTFRWLGVTIVRLPEMPITAFDQIENPPSPEELNAQPQPGQPAPPRRRNEMRAIVAAIRECLDPICYDGYDRVVGTPAATVERMMNLWETLVAETMQRPTLPPPVSYGGPSASGTPLTDGRSTTEEWMSGGSVPGASPTSPTPSS